MTTVHLPALLACIGTALLALALFAPKRMAPASLAADAPFAHAPPAVERWSPPAARSAEYSLIDDLWGEREHIATTAPASAPPDGPTWPLLVDACADGCDPAVRCDLVEALIEVRTPWADRILRRAWDEESNPTVLDALRRADPTSSRASV